MAKKWYVVHTYSGYEHKAKAALEERIKALGKERALRRHPGPGREGRRAGQGPQEDLVAEVLPRLHPGQHGAERRDLAHREVDAQGDRLRRRLDAARRRSPRREVREITDQMAEGAVRPKPKVLFESGEHVKVIDGPFQDFNGVVEEVKPDKGKLRVLISIFGRATPVELDFVQVEKA